MLFGSWYWLFVLGVGLGLHGHFLDGSPRLPSIPVHQGSLCHYWTPTRLRLAVFVFKGAFVAAVLVVTKLVQYLDEIRLGVSSFFGACFLPCFLLVSVSP